MGMQFLGSMPQQDQGYGQVGEAIAGAGQNYLAATLKKKEMDLEQKKIEATKSRELDEMMIKLAETANPEQLKTILDNPEFEKVEKVIGSPRRDYYMMIARKKVVEGLEKEKNELSKLGKNINLTPEFTNAPPEQQYKLLKEIRMRSEAERYAQKDMPNDWQIASAAATNVNALLSRNPEEKYNVQSDPTGQLFKSLIEKEKERLRSEFKTNPEVPEDIKREQMIYDNMKAYGKSRKEIETALKAKGLIK